MVALVSMLALPLCVGNNHCCISVRGRGGEGKGMTVGKRGKRQIESRS